MFKANRVYQDLISGKEANFKGLRTNEIKNILDKAEEDCIRCLSKIDDLLSQKQAMENSLSIIRATKSRIKEG